MMPSNCNFLNLDYCWEKGSELIILNIGTVPSIGKMILSYR